MCNVSSKTSVNSEAVKILRSKDRRVTWVKMQLALNFIKVVTNSHKCSYTTKLDAKYCYFILHYHK